MKHYAQDGSQRVISSTELSSSNALLSQGTAPTEKDTAGLMGRDVKLPSEITQLLRFTAPSNSAEQQAKQRQRRLQSASIQHSREKAIGSEIEDLYKQNRTRKLVTYTKSNFDVRN